MPISVIIDTDPGVDDIIALLYAFASPEIEILAILISFGNTDVDASYDNVLKLLNVLHEHFERHPSDRERFPGFPKDGRLPLLARGARGPLEGELHSAQYFHGRDGLGNIAVDHPEITIGRGGQYVQYTPLPAHEVALNLLQDRPEGSLTYIVLGPMTNLALAARTNRDAVKRVGRVIVMGGALDVPGNQSAVGEFNFFADPFAVKELLVDEQAPIPKERFLILPLDITTPHELPFPVYTERVDATFPGTLQSTKNTPAVQSEERTDPRLNPIVHFTSAFLRRTRTVMREFGKDAMELHDVVAVWAATQNPPTSTVSSKLNQGVEITLQNGWKARRRIFQVERFGELTRGMLVVDRRDEYAATAPSYIDRATAGDGSTHAQGAERLTSGDTRAEVDEALRRAMHDLPAPVQLENEEEAKAAHHPPAVGIACVSQTPGGAVLLESMLARIWGITS